jgi:hypothetical protein
LLLTELSEGDIITEQAIIDMVCVPFGMFKNSVGKNYLMVNKVEDEGVEKRAIVILERIKAKHPKLFSGLIYGSVHDQHVQQRI